MVPPGIPDRSDRDVLPAHDPDAARALLAEAGYRSGNGFPRPTLVTGGSPYDEAVVPRLEQELGIRVDQETMDFDEYFDRLETDPPQMWFLSWVADYPGRNDFLGVLLDRFDQQLRALALDQFSTPRSPRPARPSMSPPSARPMTMRRTSCGAMSSDPDELRHRLGAREGRTVGGGPERARLHAAGWPRLEDAMRRNAAWLRLAVVVAALVGTMALGASPARTATVEFDRPSIGVRPTGTS